MDTLGKYMDLPAPPPGTPGIFAFADPERLRSVLDASGFRDIVLEEMEVDVLQVADGRAYWEAMSDLAAPVMALVDQLETPRRVRGRGHQDRRCHAAGRACVHGGRHLDRHCRQVSPGRS